MSDTKQREIPCWQCQSGVEAGTFFCKSCTTLQPPVQQNHFTLFGLEPAFTLDTKALEKTYIALQRTLHPDRFARKSDEEKRFATSHTLSLNEAYDILKNPLSRAEYLLSLQGIEVNKDTRTSVKASQDLLMESLEAREALAEAMTIEAFNLLKEQNQQHQKECVETLSKAFTDQRLDDASQAAIRLKYLVKLAEEIKAKKSNF